MSISRRARVLPAVAGLLVSVPAVLAQDVTNPGDFITALSPNFPAGEAPDFAIDNSAATKYLNFDRLGTGFDVSPSGSGVVRGLAIVTANDAPERDPTSFIVEGSFDGFTFFPIAQGELAPPLSRFAVAEVSFPNAESYVVYRVTFPTIRTPGAANSMQVAEVQLLTATDITSPADAVTVTYTDGASSPANEGGAALIDGRLGVAFGVENGSFGPTTVDITPVAGSSVVTGLNISTNGDVAAFPGRMPLDFNLLGSNDGVNYTPIFNSFLSVPFQNYEDQQFFFTNGAAYTSYRIVFGVPQAATFLQVGELRLLGEISMSAPANDTCEAATPIVSGSISGTNAFATGNDITDCGSLDSADVWYSYTAAATGMVEANTCGVGTIDTTLAVYSSCGGTLLGCNDNTCGVGARVAWSAQAGQSYLIRVAGVNDATGAFTVAIDANPEVHTDVVVPLTYNFNGMVHEGEAGDPDNLNGYRSISDRGMAITGLAGSLDVGLEGQTGIPYSVVTQAGQLDIVHLGNRNQTDGGLRPFDLVADGDEIGVQPSWLIDPVQTVPQVTDVSSLNLVMTSDTQIGVIHNASNGGGFFVMNLAFTDGSGFGVLLHAPDWFGEQNPFPADIGVEVQGTLGVFAGAGDVDNGNPSVPLNVVEAIVSTSELLADGYGDVTGRTLQSISFSDASNLSAAHAIFAVTVRDAESGGSACPPDWNDDGTVNSGDISSFLTAWIASVQAGDLVGDFNNDGATNSGDISAFLTAWIDAVSNGC